MDIEARSSPSPLNPINGKKLLIQGRKVLREQFIPAFGRIIGQMQHDFFHVYTVDEHILMVVRNLRRFMASFAHEYLLCSQLISEFDRPEILYLAGLFHDIAKGHNGDHSLLGKKEAKRFCIQHRLSAEDAELVSWLAEPFDNVSYSTEGGLTRPKNNILFCFTCKE